MPTVSVRRELLFQALGRSYSECGHRAAGRGAAPSRHRHLTGEPGPERGSPCVRGRAGTRGWALTRGAPRCDCGTNASGNALSPEGAAARALANFFTWFSSPPF